MSGRVIAVANMKGGVGKTTVVVALAEALAALGSSVLVIDADAQANASVCIAGDERLVDLIDTGRTIDAFLDDVIIGGSRRAMNDYVLANASSVIHAGRPLRISLLPASAELRQLEREMIFRLTARNYGLDAIVGTLFRLFKQQLALTQQTYDFVLIDCAPGLSAVTEASIRMADLVIVPTIPDFLSTYGLKSFCATLWKHDSQSADFHPRRLPRVLVSRRRPIKEHDRMLTLLGNEKFAKPKSFELFQSVIPEAAAVSSALSGGEGSMTFGKKWGAPLTAMFESLVKEVKEALHGA